MDRRNEEKNKPKRNILSRFLELVRRKGKAIELPKEDKTKISKTDVLEKATTSVESEVIKAKFSTPVSTQVSQPRREIPQELPSKYGQDKIVIQTRDPWWIHAYWEVTEQTRENLKRQLGDLYNSAKTILRVYDVSYINFDGTNANRYSDIEITMEANNWYINVGGSGRFWCVDLGLRLLDGRFIMIIRSNVVFTPLDGPSGVTDEEWMVPEDMFGRLYGLGIGFGKSSPLKGWQERLKREWASGAVSSLASPVRPMQERKFRLVVNTELIIYGATEANARVTIQGRPITLRPDGTFSLRFALPDGKQVIPVKSTSFEGTDEITVTPIVNKETR